MSSNLGLKLALMRQHLNKLIINLSSALNCENSSYRRVDSKEEGEKYKKSLNLELKAPSVNKSTLYGSFSSLDPDPARDPKHVNIINRGTKR